MQHDLNEIAVFARVVQAGSFTAAAKALGLPKSTVSRRVASLEARLGVTLLRRTTRRLQVTEVGGAYFQACSQALAELQEAETAAVHERGEPRGLLRVTAPVEMGVLALTELSQEFLKLHPQVELELVLTNRVLNLIEDGIDVALRAGSLVDSSLVARRLGVTRFQLFASPKYLSRSGGAPRQPADLSRHEFLRFTEIAPEPVVVLERGRERKKVRVQGRFSANELNTILELARAGHGVALLPSFLAREDLGRGRLAAVLPGWFTEQEPVHAVYAPGRFVAPKIRAFVDFLVKRLGPVFG